MNTQKEVDLYIILADDDQDDHELIKEAVRECNRNHIVSSVFNGEQLMDLLLHRGFYRHENKRRPDLLILDLGMPVMDGIEALRQIRVHGLEKKMRIHVLTDSVNPAQRDTVLRLGASSYHKKPLHYEQLRHLLNDFCQNSSPGQVEQGS